MPHDDAFDHEPPGCDAAALRRSIAHRLTYTIGKDPITATTRDWQHALAYVVRDRLTTQWMRTMRTIYRTGPKRVYYLSLEYLTGRLLHNSLLNMDLFDVAEQALRDLGLDFDLLRLVEPDAALGNGGLGRLAACLLDSMATLRLPGYAYGIRYDYGMFYQRIEQGQQVEHPENWLRYGNPWEFARPEVLYPVKFGGRVVDFRDDQGRAHHQWLDTEEVMAMAYDTPVPGYRNGTVLNLRLWSAKASRDFDLRYFNEGDYIKAVEDKNRSENLARVLYPVDTTSVGRELRLKQQYFFASASLQDILFRFTRQHGDLAELPDKAAIQLNDTHPAIAIAELMRLLVDVHEIEWEKAWELTQRTFAYTNHTLLPEALETWSVALFERLLPRHLQIIYDINHRHLEQVRHHFPGDLERLRRMSLIDERAERRVRMAALACVGSHRVNGVSALHTELLQRDTFADAEALWPGRIVNVTNGITPRRWLHQANPELSGLVSEALGDSWITDLDRLAELAPLAEDAAFRARFRAAKQANKARLATLIAQHTGLQIQDDVLFDVQIKRIHEYKRQLLNLLHVITLYNRIRLAPDDGYVPRVCLFAGKAAPSYALAKLVIRLINDVADVVNNDPAVGDRLRVLFVQNYDVSTAADIIPAADLSEQISLAGTEASGTGNMKLALNGALTIGTLDGANIEIRERVGAENFFAFGLDTAGAARMREANYRPASIYHEDERLQQALDMVCTGYFSPEEPTRYRGLVDRLLDGGDRFLVLADFAAYLETQARVDALWQDPEAWSAAAIRNVAAMGHFSSDRTVREYARQVWGVTPLPAD
ncbi:MAG: glycogen/starch/alpha-glucan family phosphorylase [Gammaproteobacteria bacterium]|jgi:starch phosphorylase|nr:glycogen/starch/alpha-glucan family phosphorylase [Gammaproteobacteria bacterium]